MSMVCGLDLHRGQITYDALIEETGEIWRGRIWSPDRAPVPALVGGRRGQASERRPGGHGGGGLHRLALRGRGDRPRLASRRTWPSRPRPRRPGTKKRAKTDRSDARLQRELLQRGELPESWIPPDGVSSSGASATRLYKTLVDERRMWVQRIHAELFQHGVALPEGEIRSEEVRTLAGRRRRCSSARPPVSASRWDTG